MPERFTVADGRTEKDQMTGKNMLTEVLFSGSWPMCYFGVVREKEVINSTYGGVALHQGRLYRGHLRIPLL